MTVEDVGREGLHLASRVAGVAVAVPLAAGYFTLGAAVLVGRSLLDVARETWGRLPSLGGEQPAQRPREPKVARQ